MLECWKNAMLFRNLLKFPLTFAEFCKIWLPGYKHATSNILRVVSSKNNLHNTIHGKKRNNPEIMSQTLWDVPVKYTQAPKLHLLLCLEQSKHTKLMLAVIFSGKTEQRARPLPRLHLRRSWASNRPFPYHPPSSVPFFFQRTNVFIYFHIFSLDSLTSRTSNIFLFWAGTEATRIQEIESNKTTARPPPTNEGRFADQRDPDKLLKPLFSIKNWIWILFLKEDS